MLKSLDPKHQGMFFIVPLNILRIHEVEYDDDHSIASYFEELKKIVISSLKKKGYDNGHEKLIQDEIFSPTFEELLIILCLDKVESNLSKKIKPIFNDKLNSGNSLHQLKDEIFSYFESEIRDNETLNKSNIKTEIIGNPLEKDINDCNNFVDMCETNIQEDFEDEHSNATEALVTEPMNQIWIKQDEESEDDVISSPEYEEDESMNEKLDELVSNEPTNTVAQTGDFNCFKCNKKFISAERLEFHVKISHNLTEINIEDCVEKFASVQEHVLPKFSKRGSYPRLPKRASDPSSNEKTHPSSTEKTHPYSTEKTHRHSTEKTTEICPHCGKTIVCGNLAKHILFHTHPQNKCKGCGRCFKTQEKLESHLEKHGGIHIRIRRSRKIVKCDKCNRHFPSVEKYGVHTCKHFVCDICQEDFVFRGNLEKHKKMHEGETIFPCVKCEKICLTR